MMDINRDKNLELQRAGIEFNNKITNLTVTTAKNNGIVLSNEDENNFLHKKIKKELQVDGYKLARLASNLIEKDKEMTDEKVAIELLKEISNNGESKTMKKLASKMIKEKWWQNNENN